MPYIENCTANSHTLYAKLKVGMVKVALGPAEISENIDQRAIDALRNNSAVELLFRHRLMQVVKTKVKAETSAATAKPVPKSKVEPAPKKKGEGKSKLDLELGL